MSVRIPYENDIILRSITHTTRSDSDGKLNSIFAAHNGRHVGRYYNTKKRVISTHPSLLLEQIAIMMTTALQFTQRPLDRWTLSLEDQFFESVVRWMDKPVAKRTLLRGFNPTKASWSYVRSREPPYGLV